MTIKTILTPIVYKEDSSANLEASIALAKRFDSHLVGFNIILKPDILIPYGWSGEAGTVFLGSLESVEEEAKRRSDELFTYFRQRCDTEGIKWDTDVRGLSASWVADEGVFPDSLGYSARVADLVVLSHSPGDDRPADLGLAEAAIIGGGRPALIVPRDKGPYDYTRIVVAWDGTRVAGRALTAALPFLEQAQSVALLAVDRGDQPAPDVSAAAAYIKRHGIDVHVEVPEPHCHRTGEALHEHAKRLEAGLFVMGAYVNRPWRHLIQGSVTADLIKRSDFPILMSH